MDTPRNHFTFFRSYYEAIKELPQEFQAELLMAIVEYGLNDAEMTETLSQVSKAFLRILKPILDKSKAKSQGGQKSKRGPAKPAEHAGYSATPAQEVATLKEDTAWIINATQSLGVKAASMPTLLDKWADHCTGSGKTHRNIEDAKTHFCHWYQKQPKVKPTPTKPTADDYNYSGGFGGMDI